MSENLYNKILGVNPEVYNPDYYQLLLIQAENATPELIEKQYKTQMSKVQNVRSTKYKDFVEFLKGELKQARRILNDPKLRERYEERRNEESSEKLSEIVEMFIQISGNLSEIEIREIHRQGNHLNLTRRDIDKIIDENLQELRCKRMKATPAQLKRASEILKRRANKGIVSESQLLFLTADGDYVTQRPENNSNKNGSDEKKLEQMKADAEKLNQLADLKEKYRPLVLTLKIMNLIFNIAGWVLVLGLIFVILFMKNDPAIDDTLRSVFNVEPKIIEKEVYVGKPEVKEVPKNELEKFKESYVNPSKEVSYREHVINSRNMLLEVCERLENKSNEDLYEEALAFYSNIIAPNYYNTQTRWEWQMFTKPFDFKNRADFFSDNFAEFSAVDVDKEMNFGGNFTCGQVEIAGSITDGPCNFGFDLQSNSSKDHMRCRIYNDENGSYYFESRHLGEDIPDNKALRVKKIETQFPLVNFKLELNARTSMNNDTNRSIELNYMLKITDINGKEIQTPLWDEITYVSNESSQISLFIGKDSKIRIRRISVEPYN